MVERPTARGVARFRRRGTLRQVTLYRSWRSQVLLLLFTVATSVIAAWLSITFPHSVVRGEVISISGYTLYLSLPIFWLVPCGLFLFSIFRLYDAKFVFDDDGVETVKGLLSLTKTACRVSYEDIRGLESDQTLLERFLVVGSVDIGTAGSSAMELHIDAIYDPLAVKRFLQKERDRRIALTQVSGEANVA